MPNISAGSSEIAKSGFTTNQYAKRKGAADAVNPNTIVDEKYLLAWYDFGDTSTLWKDAAGTVAVTTHDDRVARIDNKAFTLGETANQPDKFGKFARTFDANGLGGPLYKINSFTCNGNGSVRWSVGADKGLITSAAPGFGGMSPGIWTRQTTNTGAITSFYVFQPNDGPTKEGHTVDMRIVAVANNSSGATYYEDEFDIGYFAQSPGNDEIQLDVKHSNGASNTVLESSSVRMPLQSATQIWTVEQGSESVAGSPNDQYYMYKSGNRTIGVSGTTSKLQTQNHGGGWMEFGADCTDNVCTSETANTQLNGCIFEVIIYNKILSKAELEDVHNYLLDKYKCATDQYAQNQDYPANLGGPNLWGNMLGWYDFTDPSWMTQNADGTGGAVTNGSKVGRVYNKAAASNCGNCVDYPMRYGNFLRTINDSANNKGTWYGPTGNTGNVASGQGYLRFNGFQQALIGGYPTGGVSAADWGGISATQFNNGSALTNRFTMYIIYSNIGVHQDDRYLFNAKGKGFCGTTLNEYNIIKEPSLTGGGAPLPAHYKTNFIENGCGLGTLTLDQGGNSGGALTVMKVEMVAGTDNNKLYMYIPGNGEVTLNSTVKDTGTLNPVSIISLNSTTAGEAMMAIGGKIANFDVTADQAVSPVTTNQWTGRIYEVMIFETANMNALHINQQNHIVQYIMWKYNQSPAVNNIDVGLKIVT
tara:strand:- start:23119 stop:25224 length:2106 start_codon:yes stop_codon:yes gene_type:complete